MELIQTVNDFDKLLVQVTEETVKYCLGDVNATIIWNYLEERNYPISEIPNRPEILSEELRNIMGFGRRQILGAVAILEKQYLKSFVKSWESNLNVKNRQISHIKLENYVTYIGAEIAGGEGYGARKIANPGCRR